MLINNFTLFYKYSITKATAFIIICEIANEIKVN